MSNDTGYGRNFKNTPDASDESSQLPPLESHLRAGGSHTDMTENEYRVDVDPAVIDEGKPEGGRSWRKQLFKCRFTP